MTPEEEEFKKALRKSHPMKAVRELVPMLGGGVVALIFLVLVMFYWPLPTIPVVAVAGIPILAGAGAFILLQKVLGADR